MTSELKTSDKDPIWTLHQWDARNLGALLDRHSRRPFLATTITSPPYGGLKDYDHTDQIGYGQSYEDYLAEMRSIFAELFVRTREDGSLWVIADSYIAQSGSPARLIPVPFDLSRVAEEAGWTLRDVIIWEKDRTLPWSNGTRLRNSFEYVLFLARGPKTKYRLDRLREHGDSKEWWVRFPERYHPDGKAPSNVWQIPIPQQGSWGIEEIAHACPLPPELVKRLVLLSTDPGDVVFDPFAGSGVVLAQASSLGRPALGCELVERHIADFERVVRPSVERKNGTPGTNGHNGAARQTIFDLRILKLARVLTQQAARRRLEVAWPSAVLVLRGRRRTERPSPKIIFVIDSNQRLRSKYLRCARELTGRPPASKFGVDPELDVVTSKELTDLVRGHRLYVYRSGKTARASDAVRHSDLKRVIASARTDSIPPIISNIHLDIAPLSDSSVLAAGGK